MWSSDDDSYDGVYGGYCYDGPDDDFYDVPDGDGGYYYDGPDDRYYHGPGYGPRYVFDDERYLFEFNQNSLHYDDPMFLGGRTYRNLVLLIERTSELLGAWKNRSRSDLQEETNADHPNPYLNLYQLYLAEDRVKFRLYSARKFAELLGGEEEVEKFIKKIKYAVAFVKRVFNVIISRCLPMELPYPAMNNILSHLMRDGGLHNVGFLSSEDEDESGEFTESVVINRLYYSLAVVYRYMKIILFNSEPGIVLAADDMRDSIQLFEKNFDDLRAVLGPKLGTGENAELEV